MNWLINGMIYLGSALMIYNIYGFIRYARSFRKRIDWEKGRWILYLPVALLVFFLLGYLAVGIFGEPDIIVSGILFGGSIFVFVMYLTLRRTTSKILEGKRLEAELIAAEESSKAKMEFLANISHEMRTPMNVILGIDALALKNPDISGELRSQLEKIGGSARHLLDLINNLLYLNGGESVTGDIKKAPFSGALLARLTRSAR